ncbi:uncharacterized protein Dana_GF20100 [Drosophila ananassae]|uniref:Insulin-like peptide 5 n=1 Tax=Drosophila ananassae TaxID=7217 RepID=B3MA62_DROAN|nr:probable insulin-like peptide 5 [Drosophila ananassae]EDV39076.2 uncharacterized protein Dana_GF20100 [Drosophila ananassae]DBA35927.1 TPA: Insulin-like peptide 5 [Drosophila ananassae]
MRNLRTKMICLLLPWLLVTIPLLEGVPTKREVPMIICGEQLTNELRKICGNRFNKVIKKSQNTLNLFDYVDHLEDNESDIFGPNQNLVMQNSRVIRNVAWECCTHGPCTRSHLESYCS